MMTDRQEFVVGFLLKCAEAGLYQPDDIIAVIDRIVTEAPVKRAIDVTGLIGTAGRTAWDAAKFVGDKALSWGLPVAVIAPPLIGGVAGAVASRAVDGDDTTVDEFKRNELIEALNAETNRLRREAEAKQFKQAIRGTPIV